MEHTYHCHAPEELEAVATDILCRCGGPGVFAVHGEMGSGKTTLIKYLCRVLGVTDNVSSPTFALVNEYHRETAGPVFHFDVYRIKKTEEMMDIGYEQYFFSNEYVFVEWPEKISELLPEKHVYIMIRETEDRKREILLKY
jgi:tRNA threonylcarbamoyladenosine biosynthesis protein TsaE